jgi:hypothetical protein
VAQIFSGRRDLNPRPVAAATALQTQALEFIATTARFVISLSFWGFGATRKAFTVDQSPRHAMSGGFGMAQIVPPKTFNEVLARSQIATTGLAAA